MIMVRALERGISLSDFNDMTVGMLIGYIQTYNNLNGSKKEDEEECREATQADFDNF